MEKSVLSIVLSESFFGAIDCAELAIDCSIDSTNFCNRLHRACNRLQYRSHQLLQSIAPSLQSIASSMQSVGTPAPVPLRTDRPWFLPPWVRRARLRPSAPLRGRHRPPLRGRGPLVSGSLRQAGSPACLGSAPGSASSAASWPGALGVWLLGSGGVSSAPWIRSGVGLPCRSLARGHSSVVPIGCTQ